MLISVVIPTLNEDAHIRFSVESIQSQSGPFEIIVADGGSVDGTLEAIPPGIRRIQAPRGRSSQMNAGADAAVGEVLLFLHADTTLPAAGLDEIRSAINRGATAGIFRLQFDDATLLLRLSSRATRLKSKLLCFGDRGLFVTAAAFRGAGGFPDIPLFEDLEFVRGLPDGNQFAFLPLSVVTSSRRYQQVGDWKQQWKNVKLWLRYLRGESPSALAADYQS